MRLLRSVERRHEPLSMEAGKMKNNQQRILMKSGQRNRRNCRQSVHWESSDESVFKEKEVKMANAIYGSSKL